MQLQRLHDMTSPDQMLESRADDPDHDGSDDGNDLMVEEECADVSDRADELILDSKDAPDANALQAADPPRSLISCAVRSQLPKSDFQEEPDTPAPRFDSHRMCPASAVVHVPCAFHCQIFDEDYPKRLRPERRSIF